MKTSVREWLAKADGDRDSTVREYLARKRPNYDSACFHAQQCIEKLLKATIDAEGGKVTKVHDLAVLLNDCLAKHPLWSVMRDDLEMLSQYAVLFRYPGHSADKAKAKSAITAMNRCRSEILTSLGMPGFDAIIARARQQTNAGGMTPADITKAVAKVRGRGPAATCHARQLLSSAAHAHRGATNRCHPDGGGWPGQSRSWSAGSFPGAPFAHHDRDAAGQKRVDLGLQEPTGADPSRERPLVQQTGLGQVV